VIATAASIAATWFVQPTQQRWAALTSLFLAIAVIVAAPAQRELSRVQNDWDAWRGRASMRGLADLRRALDQTSVDLVRAARAALDVPADRVHAFAQLSDHVTGPAERGVVVLRGDSAYAWAGVIRPPVDTGRDGVSVIATSFYLALEALERRGNERAIAVALIDAAPPADTLSSPLARRIAAHAGLSGFTFGPPGELSNDSNVLPYAIAGARVFDVRAAPLVQGEVVQRVTEAARARAGLAFLLALGCFVIGVWRGTRALTDRIAALAVGLACTALAPLNEYSNLTRLFDPAFYYTPEGGPLTGNAGALATTSAIVLLGIMAVLRQRSRRVSRWAAAATVLLVAGLGPFLLRDLARGLVIPMNGVDSTLWLIWEIPLFLAAVTVLLAGSGAGAAVLGPTRGLPPVVAPAAAAIAALLAPIVWSAPGRWPWWYTIVWIVAIVMLALSRRSRYVILSASTVAALGAATLVWGRAARGRVEAAERDLAGLTQVDPVARTLLERFGASLAVDYAPVTRQALLQHYVSSDLAAADYPVALAAWPTDSGPVAQFETSSFEVSMPELARMVARARQTGTIGFETYPTSVAVELLMAAPGPAGGVTTVVLAPHSRLFAVDPFASMLGLGTDLEAEPPYTVRLRAPVPASMINERANWRREGTELHGDWVVRTGTGAAPVHVEVELRPLGALVQRGALILLLDLAIVALLWLASVVADGGAGRWLRVRRRRWGRSYRAQLSLALFAFFVIPAIAFALWAYGELATDARESRSVLVNETLRAATPPPVAPLWLPAESDRLDTPLFLYRGGELREASDPLYDQLAPTGRFLEPDVELTLAVRNEETATRVEDIDGGSTLFGYRAFHEPGVALTVLAAPARADALALGRRRRDLGILVLFTTALGALAALWLSGIAARKLARPIAVLREAALSIAGGGRMPPLESEPTIEFNPVFSAFRRMGDDLSASRSALEEAQRRTAAVLRNVASGVVAVDADGRVALANPRAESLLGASLPAGALFAQLVPAVAGRVERFIKSQDDGEDFELALDQQQLRGTLTRLARGGAVVTLDDVTELARAQRVLAWGEMARQVAHEIKNPLTPIRLGVQHLRRARADARVDFDRVLEQNVNQILAEIDRLDEIARAFSRYGAAPDERRQPSRIDVAAVVREVVSLERMGAESSVAWQEAGADVPLYGFARGDELKEVLLNVLENARLAGANAVRVSVELAPTEDGGRMLTISVRDDGRGIPADVLHRVFEPHFSTRTSGSGLGLAISRQLVEGWGGSITLDSTVGQGTTVLIQLRASDPE